MKIYEINYRQDVERWLESQGRRVVNGYYSAAIIYTRYVSSDDGWSRLDEGLTHIPFLAFAMTGATEAEACMRLALVINEYLEQHPGEAIRVRRPPTVENERCFDTGLPRWMASARLLCDKHLDDAETERAKRAE